MHAATRGCSFVVCHGLVAVRARRPGHAGQCVFGASLRVNVRDKSKKVYTGEHQRALRKGSQLAPTRCAETRPRPQVVQGHIEITNCCPSRLL